MKSNIDLFASRSVSLILFLTLKRYALFFQGYSTYIFLHSKLLANEISLVTFKL